MAVEKQGYRQGSEMVRYANKQYGIAQKQIEQEIALWYSRVSENNEISYADAKKLLNKAELKEFKWSVEEYLEKARENNINQKWVKELTNASAKVHITRLEAMLTAVRQAIEELGNNVERNVNEGLGGVYEDQIYRTAYEVQTGRGIAENFGKIDEKQIAEALKKPWTKDRKTFSDRIWSNKDRLVNSVDKIITNGLIRGDSIAEMTNRLQKAMESERYSAERIIRTETAAIASRAHIDSFEETGVEKVEVCETLDGRTCEVCGSKDGTVAELKKARVGTNIPPFHPNCRGCVLPYFDDEYFKEGQTRIARDESGKSYTVDDMTYKEWKDKFVVAKSEESGIIKSLDVDDFNIFSKDHNIKDEVANVITGVIKSFERKYDMYISEARFGDFKDEATGKSALMQITVNEWGLTVININSKIMGGKTVEEIDSLIAKALSNLPQTLEEAVVHECGHAKAYYGKSIKEIEKMNTELSSKRVKGVSRCAEMDGAECIAEVEVLLYRGESVPQEAMELYNGYVGRKNK